MAGPAPRSGTVVRATRLRLPGGVFPRPALLVLGSATAYGMSPVLMKVAIAHGMTTLAVLSFRSLLATPLLLAALALTRPLTFPRGRHLALLAVIGATLVPIQPFGYLTSLRFMPVSSAAVLISLSPAHVAWIAWVFLGERLRRVEAVILVILVVGAVLVAGETPTVARAQGLAALLAASGAAAVYAVAARRILQDVPPVAAFTVLLPVSTGVFVLAALLSAEWMIPLDAASLWATAGSALFAGVAGPLLLLQGLRHLPAPQVAMLGTFEPVVTVLLSMAVLKDRLTAVQALGMLAILGGITALQLVRARGSPPVRAGISAES